VRIRLTALLMTALSVVAFTACQLEDPGAEHVVSSWDVGTQGWIANGGAADHAAGFGRRGYTDGDHGASDGSLRWTGTRTSTGWTGQLVFSADLPEDATGQGADLRTYVFVPPSNPAGTYEARLAVQHGSNWQWSFGPAVVLAPGAWTQVNWQGVPAEARREKRRYAVSLDSKGAVGTVVYHIDDYYQGNFGGGGSTATTTAPTTTSSSTTSSSTTTAPSTSAPAPTGNDALIRRETAYAQRFVNWLGGRPGYIGEIGWPNDQDQAAYNTLGSHVYRVYDSADIAISHWAAGSWWGNYNLLAYGGSGSRRSPADVVEAYPQRPGVARGVNLNGAEFGQCGGGKCNSGTGTGATFSNVNRGTHNGTYVYESTETMQWLYNRGVRTIRLPFRWERIQPTLGGNLDAAELGRLNDIITRARGVGLDVIPTVMNYGAYWLHDPACNCGVRQPIGSAAVTNAHFANLWSRLTSALNAHPNVKSLDLMNEPVSMPGGDVAWEGSAQAAVDAIRSAGGNQLVWVEGYAYANPYKFGSGCPVGPCIHTRGPWINDPLNRTGYSAHHYFTDNPDGHPSYSVELSKAQKAGW
jgi:hypothetical protein